MRKLLAVALVLVPSVAFATTYQQCLNQRTACYKECLDLFANDPAALTSCRQNCEAAFLICVSQIGS